MWRDSTRSVHALIVYASRSRIFPRDISSFARHQKSTMILSCRIQVHSRMLIVLVSILVSLITVPSWAFSIVSAYTEKILRPGQSIDVQVDLEEVGVVTVVKFYWYGNDEDMLEEFIEEKLALIANAKSTPPFGGVIKVPRQAIGDMRLLAVGDNEGGSLTAENWAIFDEKLLHVEPKVDLQEIHFETESPLRLGRAGMVRVYEQIDALGKIIVLPVVGRYADGVSRLIRFKSTGTTFDSSNETVVRMLDNGLMRLVGNGKATITARNHGKEATLDVHVETIDTPNEPPVASLEPQHVVRSGTRVTLNALNSYDPEGESLEYHWSQIRGSKVALLDPNSAKASFLAPSVTEERLFRFKLRVTDVAGADSEPVFVDVIVQP